MTGALFKRRVAVLETFVQFLNHMSCSTYVSSHNFLVMSPNLLEFGSYMEFLLLDPCHVFFKSLTLKILSD
jgi:hypothetical protein